MTYEKTFGSQFKIGDGDLASTPTYTTVAQVKNIGDVATALRMAEVTNHGSSGGWAEHIPSGIKDVEDISITLVYDAAQATHANAAGGVIHAHLNETKLAYQIVLPDTGSTTWTFEAYVTNVNTQIGEGEDALMQEITIKITGAPTLT